MLSVRYRNLILAFGLPVLLAATACLLWPGIHGPFLFDDLPNFKNLEVLNGHLNRHSIGVYLSLFPGTPGRPLSALSFLINDYAWPSQPLGFKITNLWIHLLNGVLVFGLARTLASAHADRQQESPRADAIALVCAAIWLLNPIQISAIFLTVQRMAQLAATFMFAGLWAYAAIAVRARTAWQAFAALAAAGVATILGILSKENAVLIPLLGWVLNTTLLCSSLARLPATSRRFLSWGMIAANGAIAFMFAWKWRSLTSFSSRDYDMWERVMTQGRALLDYIGLILVPRLSSSSLYNDGFAISRGLFDPASTLPALILVGCALGAGLALRKRTPLLSFALLWFLAAHAIESTVFPLEMYFEHRNYVPLFGPAFAIAAGALSARGKLRVPVLTGLALWLLMSAGIIHLQAKVWGDRAMLATIWRMDRPDSLRAQQEYARYLFETGRPGEAHAVLTAAATHDISPVDTQLQAMIVECSARGTLVPGEVDTVGKLLATEVLGPGTAMAMASLRHSVQRGDCPEALSPEAWLWLTQQVLDSPRGLSLNRMLRVERAELFLAANQLDAAINELNKTWSPHRQDPRVAFYAAALLATAGRYDEAREWAKRPLGQPWTWKRWLAQTDEQARLLIDAIDKSQIDQRKASDDIKEATPHAP